MNHSKKIVCLFLTMFLIVATSEAVGAQDNAGFDRELLKVKDQLWLQSGAVLKGVIGDVPADKKEPVSFQTITGETMLIDAKLIDKVDRADAVSGRYNAAVEKMDDDAQSHRDMVAWCEEQEKGRARFRNQILFHRKRILVFEPDDRSARTKLGYTYLKDENRWVDENKFWSTQGYTRRGSRWNSNLHQETVEQLEDLKSQLVAKRKKFGAWRGRVRRMSELDAVNSLVAFAEPALMPHILEAYAETKDPALRAIYVQVFASARPTTSSAVSGLIIAYMDDGSDLAIDYLMQDEFSKVQIASRLTKFLVSKNNATVRRAGYALGELGSVSSILALGRALETKHLVVPGSNNTGAQRVQGNAGGESFNFGGNKPVTRVFRNEEVRDALRKITGQDFGFNEEAYQAWYVENYTHVDLKARR